MAQPRIPLLASFAEENGYRVASTTARAEATSSTIGTNTPAGNRNVSNTFFMYTASFGPGKRMIGSVRR